MPNKLTTKVFIERSKKVHGEDTYDYSPTVYNGVCEKVLINCKKHGEFEQTPDSHIRGSGCPECAIKRVSNSRRNNIEEVLKKIEEKCVEKGLKFKGFVGGKYVNNKTKLILYCHKHGEWDTTSYARFINYNSGCPKCGGSYKSNTADFIEKSKKVHGEDTYDYTPTEYKGAREKVRINCKEHGVFEQTATNHLRGYGCSKCGKNHNYNTEEWVEKAREVHPDKEYDYSKTVYNGAHEKVIIICHIHGEFLQQADSHLSGRGCPKCYGKNKTTKEWISEAKKVHSDKEYDYSKSKYLTTNKKVCIICPKHGEFWQSPSGHLNGSGCPICKNEKIGDMFRSNLKEFIKKCRKIHPDNKYDYSKVEYVNDRTKVCIICTDHGEFLQRPNHHLRGVGCPICKNSKLEMCVRNILLKLNINFEIQKTFSWLKNKQKLKLDFYLPEYNIAIECQGEQHFKKFRFEKCDSELKYRQKNDQLKQRLCEQNGIKLFYINFDDSENDIEIKLKNWLGI